MREVLISKNTIKSRRNRLSSRRAAQARRKAIQAFNGRLGTFLLIFQHPRKTPTEEGVNTSRILSILLFTVYFNTRSLSSNFLLPLKSTQTHQYMG